MTRKPYRRHDRRKKSIVERKDAKRQARRHGEKEGHR